MRIINKYRSHLFALILIILVILTFILAGSNQTVLIGITGTLVSIYIGINLTNIHSDRLLKELFTEFNNKYDEKYNDCLNGLQSSTDVVNSENRGLIVDYINLCSEEYFWYTKGRIPKIIWTNWKAGILFHLQIPSIKKKVFQEEKKYRESYYGLFDVLEVYL